MILLTDLFKNEIEQLMVDRGYPKFRGSQIHDWLMKGASSFDDMKNLPKDLRNDLEQDENIAIGIPKTEGKLVSNKDGTRKYVVSLYDGNIVECVLLKYEYGYSCCVSTQAGCRMGCRFCASTGIGFSRGLYAGEILGQILLMQKDAGERISNVVLMGIGEPFDNYDNVLRFFHLVNAKDGLNIGMRHITVSTCGIVPRIRQLADEKLQITLAVSLHAADDETRNSIMPVNKKYPLKELLKACDYYFLQTGRRVTFEYAIIKNVNQDRRHAKQLADILKGRNCHLNLISINEIPGDVYKKEDDISVKAFADHVRENGVEVTIRRELGSDIDAACGQLRRSILETKR